MAPISTTPNDLSLFRFRKEGAHVLCSPSFKYSAGPRLSPGASILGACHSKSTPHQQLGTTTHQPNNYLFSTSWADRRLHNSKTLLIRRAAFEQSRANLVGEEAALNLPPLALGVPAAVPLHQAHHVRRGFLQVLPTKRKSDAHHEKKRTNGRKKDIKREEERKSYRRVGRVCIVTPYHAGGGGRVSTTSFCRVDGLVVSSFWPCVARGEETG